MQWARTIELLVSTRMALSKTLTIIQCVCALMLGACTNDATEASRPECLEAVDVEGCAPLYAASFNEIHTRRLSVTCASPGASCHSNEGRQGGLSLADPAESYELLLGLRDGQQRVVPGDPRCSELMVRLDTAGQDFSMPPGMPLDERERCTIRRWIAAGAERN